VRPNWPRFPAHASVFEGGWGSGAVQILLTSYDPEALEQTAQALTREVRNIPQLTDVQSTAAALSPEIVVHPDSLGLPRRVSVESIARTALIATMGDIDANRPKI